MSVESTVSSIPFKAYQLPDANNEEMSVTIVDVYDVKSGFKWPVLARADAHHDNPHCDRVLEKKHLDEAKEKNAGVIDVGDFFCVMQGKYDKRSSRSALDEKLQTGDYGDKVVEFNSDFLEPYAANLIDMRPGNHETAFQDKHETNLTKRLIERLNAKTGSNIQLGTYAGWIIFRFWFSKTRMTTVRVFCHHGYGGAAPVSRGVMDTARTGLYLADADIVIMGHVHHAYEMPIVRMRVDKEHKVSMEEQVHIRVPGYKDEFKPGRGFQVERGAAPRPKGSAWIEFYVEPGDCEAARIRYNVMRAK